MIQQPHIPEVEPDVQLQIAIDHAEDSDAQDGAYHGSRWVANRQTLSPLQRAYSALSLLESGQVSAILGEHWTEDAGLRPESLIDELYVNALQYRTETALNGGRAPRMFGYSQSQPTSLDEYPDPAETFADLRDKAEADSERPPAAIVSEFQQEYKEWPDIVVVQHILYLITERGVRPESSGYEDQFGHGEPSGSAVIGYVFDSILWFMTETWVRTEEAVEA